MRDDLTEVQDMPGVVDELEVKPLGLGAAWLACLVAGLAMFGLVSLTWYTAAFWTYLGCGFVMSRFVMRRLIEFHPVNHTIANEFSAKIGMFLFRPVRMPILLFKLTANRVL